MVPELVSNTVMVEPVAVEKWRSATVIVVAFILFPVISAVTFNVLPDAVEKFKTALFTDPELASNTVMVEPVAVEKFRSFTVISCIMRKFNAQRYFFHMYYLFF
jgi:hypothetical protein